MNEIDEKVDRLARLAARRGLGGILLNTQPNFSWLTGGRSNQIDGSRESGGGSLLVSARASASSSPTTSRCRGCSTRRSLAQLLTLRVRWTEEQALRNGHRPRPSARRRRHRVRQRPGRRRLAR
jgi:hypothetical protein